MKKVIASITLPKATIHCPKEFEEYAKKISVEKKINTVINIEYLDVKGNVHTKFILYNENN